MLSIAKKMEQKMGKGCFIFSQTETKNWSNQQSFHKTAVFTKEKLVIIFHHGAEYFLLEQRLVHEDIRADTSQRSRYVLLRVRFFFLFIFLSLSTEEDRRNHHRRI